MKSSRFKNCLCSLNNILTNDKLYKILGYAALTSVAMLTVRAFGADLLAGTEATLLDTLKGTGKKYLYIAECIVSLLVYIQTKNVMVLIGIIVVAVFFNIMLTMAA
jgi:hypothetical protein